MTTRMKCDPDAGNPVFLQKAEALKQPLKKWTVRPLAEVRVIRDPSAWQGWKTEQVLRPADFRRKECRTGTRMILDFGEEFVGRFRLALRGETLRSADSPVRLKFLFAETPLEIAERNRKYTGGLSRAWIQEEVVTFENLPCAITLPRVYAMRYVFIEVLAGFRHGFFRIEDASFTAQSCFRRPLPPLDTFDETDRLLDLAAQRTLRNCMQDVVLDGPKRDRRLWVGDLRIEAQVNAVTCRAFNMIERCIYLIAAFSDERGHIPASVYDKPFPHPSSSIYSDQAFQFADLVLFHYCTAGKKRAFLEDLYPVCRRQFEIYKEVFADGLPARPIHRWTNIDWSSMDQSVGELGTYIFGMRKLCMIARLLGRMEDIPPFEEEIRFLCEHLRSHWFDSELGVFVSGPRREVSWGSQIWMVLAEVVTGVEARKVMEDIERIPFAVKPVTPALYHHLLAVYEMLGEREKMHDAMRGFWGKMLEKGMTVYPEIFSVENERLTPYGDRKDPRINSACHAYGASPAYFLRRDVLSSCGV